MDKKNTKKPKKAPKQKRARAKAPKKPKPIVIFKEAVPKKPCCTDVSKTGSGYQIPFGYANMAGTTRLGQPEQTPYAYLERLRNVEKAILRPVETPEYIKVPIVEPSFIKKAVEVSYVPLPVYESEKAAYEKPEYEKATKPARRIPVAEPMSEFEDLPIAYATDYEFANPSPFMPEEKVKRKYVRKTSEQKEAEAMKKEETRTKRIEKQQAKALGKK